MKLRINGEEREVSRSGTVRELAAELGLPEKSVLVEHNGLALRPEEWAARRLAEGDRVEFVRVVAGG